jgi:hypothetical protein
MNDMLPTAPQSKTGPRYVFDVRMLEVLEVLKNRHIIRFDSDFTKAIGQGRQILTAIRAGRRSFTALDIWQICERFSINANYINGFSEVMFRDEIC